jgi:hypothetical protein
MGIKGSNSEPRVQINQHEKTALVGIVWVQQSRLSKRLAATADCNDPVKLSIVSNIDQRVALPRRHTAANTARPLAPIGEREFDSAAILIAQGESLPDLQPKAQASRPAARPCCPKCQPRTEVRNIAAARAGFRAPQ